VDQSGSETWKKRRYSEDVGLHLNSVPDLAGEEMPARNGLIYQANLHAGRGTKVRNPSINCWMSNGRGRGRARSHEDADEGLGEECETDILD